MTIAVTSVPHWAQFAGFLREQQSVISHAPRHSLQPLMLQFLRRNLGQFAVDQFVPLQPDELIRGAQVDWQRARNAFCEPFRAALGPCDSAAAFTDDVTRLLDQAAGTRTLVLVGLGAASSVEGRFELIVALHRCLGEVRNVGDLLLAVLDDYSLYYHEWWRTQAISRWDYLHRVHFRPLCRVELIALLSEAVPDADPAARRETAAEAEKLTGGHFALTCELIEDIRRRNATLPRGYWKTLAPQLLARSHALDSIRAYLHENVSGLTAAAVEFEQPKPVHDYHSPILQTLRRIGVLQWTSSTTARTCPGVISEMVAGLRKDMAEHSGASGARAVLGAGPPGDDDIVVVHISDIHLGDPYAFRVGDATRHDRRSASEMIAEDLKACGIRRVDAFVFSGDFTERAEMSEFLRAKEMLTDLLEAAGSSWQQAIVVAGNHDVRWNPPSAARIEQPSGVSRDEFSAFRQLVGKGAEEPAEVHVVVSQSGRNALRIVTLDSNLVEGPAAGGVGFISMDALQSVQPLLDSVPVPPSVERLSTWVVVHHHVLPVTSSLVSAARERHVSVMANAAALLSFARLWGAEMILHGHEHQPSLTITTRWPGDRGKELLPLSVAGAGSFGCKQEYLGPFARNHYFIHVRRANDILVRSRMTGDERLAWVTHDDIALPAYSIGRAHPTAGAATSG